MKRFVPPFILLAIAVFFAQHSLRSIATAQADDVINTDNADIVSALNSIAQAIRDKDCK